VFGDVPQWQKEFHLSPLDFAVEGWGKLRRFYLVRFRRNYVKKMHALRRGQCLRCGACCSITIRCPHLKDHNRCTIYERRYEQCRLFPIDPRDLRGRLSACGYRFVRTEPETSEQTRESFGEA